MLSKFIITTALVFACAAVVAAPSAVQIKQLGTTLTPWGAEKAGNKEGTIPEYTGGLTTPPANYDPKRPGWRPDPFAREKPLVRIDAKNMEQYGDRLSPGTKELMKKYPTFFIDVYPTHRTAAYPKKVIDNTLKNASVCKLNADGESIDLSKGCHGGIPFPIPQTGVEVLWNHYLRYAGNSYLSVLTSNYVKPNGESVITSVMNQYLQFGFYDDRKDAPDTYMLIRVEYPSPTRIAGQTTLFMERFPDSERRAWSYQPATRRVRLAPDLAADTPIASTGGAKVFDEAYMFYSKLDRWDVKLVGKKELYIPYNSYKFVSPEEGGGCTREEGLMTPYHPKPSCIRWELHRVWHVQLTLKSGKRHTYSKRDLFFDEDAWHGGLQENYDQSGKLYRVHFHPVNPDYARSVPGLADNEVSLDLITGIYQIFTSDSMNVPYGPLTPMQVTPDSLQTHILKP